MIRIAMNGYAPYEIQLQRSTNGWVWGNLVLGGLPGLAVDAITGSMYKLTPNQVSASLAQSTAITAGKRDMLTVAVVLQPQPGWEKIGQLQRD